MQAEAPQAPLAHLCPAQSDHCSISVQGGLGLFLAEELVELSWQRVRRPLFHDGADVSAETDRAQVLQAPHSAQGHINGEPSQVAAKMPREDPMEDQTGIGCGALQDMERAGLDGGDGELSSDDFR